MYESVTTDRMPDTHLTDSRILILELVTCRSAKWKREPSQFEKETVEVFYLTCWMENVTYFLF